MTLPYNYQVPSTIKQDVIFNLLATIENVGRAIKELDVKKKNCKYHMGYILDHHEVGISSVAYRDLKALLPNNNLWKHKDTVIDRVEKAQKLLCVMLRVYYNLQEQYEKELKKQTEKIKTEKDQEKPQEAIDPLIDDADKPPLCGFFE